MPEKTHIVDAVLFRPSDPGCWQSILEYNGAAIIGMAGKGCVGIAADCRYGIQQMTVGTDMQKIFKVNNKTFVGLPGLATDVQTIHQKIKFRHNLYKLREERDMSCRTFSNMVSSMLYERRFGPWFVEPLIVGLEGEENKPFICNTDLLGSPVETDDFVVGGTCTEFLYGACESLFKPDMEPDELFETLAQSLMAAYDRDCISGWGGVVHIITPTEVITRTLKARQD